MVVEYNEENRFPFHSRKQGVTIAYDDVEDLYELEVIFEAILRRFPALNAESFYSRIGDINKEKDDDTRIRQTKQECDKLLKRIKICLSDEDFIHSINDNLGFGIDKVISTLYAVYGYYFYTGKRTANVIKKAIDGYKRQPIR